MRDPSTAASVTERGGAAKCAATFSYTRGMIPGTAFTPFVKTATTNSEPFGRTMRPTR